MLLVLNITAVNYDHNNISLHGSQRLDDEQEDMRNMMLNKVASFIKDSTVNVLQRQTSSTVEVITSVKKIKSRPLKQRLSFCQNFWAHLGQ